MLMSVCMSKSCGTDRGLSAVAIVTVADLPVMLDQIVDSCHSLALSGLCEAPVTEKLKLGQGDAHGAPPSGPRQGTSDYLVPCRLSSSHICVSSQKVRQPMR